MNLCKLVCLLVAIIIIYLLQTTCKKEGFLNKCEDDPTWFAVDNSDNRHSCKDIGSTASCYDRDLVGREGWERCLKTCGNCAETEVTRLPMTNLATYSGEPYETFGKVPEVSKTRQWVGKGVGKKGSGKGDIRGYIDTDRSEDITDLQDRLDSFQDIFDMITGNVKQCRTLSTRELGHKQTAADKVTSRFKGKDKIKGKKKELYAGCNNTALVCPPVPDPKKDKGHSYIKQTCTDGDDNCSIQFPAYTLKCKDIGKVPTFKDTCTGRGGKVRPTHKEMKKGCYYKLSDDKIDGQITALNKEAWTTTIPSTVARRDSPYSPNDDYVFVPAAWYDEFKKSSSVYAHGLTAQKICEDKGQGAAQAGEWVVDDLPKTTDHSCQIGDKTVLHDDPSFKHSSHSNIPTSDTCDNYYLFDMITKKDKDKGDKGTKESRKDTNKLTLGDMCPYKCNKPVIKAGAARETRCKIT